MSKKIKVRLENVDLIIHEGIDSTAQRTSTRIGVHADDFDNDDPHTVNWSYCLFEHEVDQRVYWWFTESEFKEVSNQLADTSNLYPLDNGTFIYEMSDNNEPFEITLEEVTS
tara:strand:+ start:489 stop:824 length:336 start_codon:yes stop_codon:yes gene_type:complete